MKLRKDLQPEIVYFDKQGDAVPRDAVLQEVQGKTMVEGKSVVAKYEKATAYKWMDRKGNALATTYGNIVTSIEVKPADADERRMQLLQQMREALDQGDVVESQRLQLEYHELMAMLGD